MYKALFILNETVKEWVYPAPIFDEINQLVDVYAPIQSPDVIQQNPDILKDVDIIFSSWTCPTIDQQFLNVAPNLKVVFYGAGSIKKVVTDAFWEHGVQITHAANANGVVVAQYTLGQILMSLKGVWSHMQATRRDQTFTKQTGFAGLSKSTVGIIGLGMIGRHVRQLLQPFDLNIIAYDPYASQETADELGVQLVDLDTIFKESHVVSLHAPWTPETVGIINGKHFASMRQNATFINTARGALVREDEMIDVLRDRQDIFALLDVTYPEPPVKGSPLYTLPNVVLTPHIAGVIEQNETATMGQVMLDELQQYLNDEPLKWEVTRERLKTMA
jgi:phosphoglycerate dehydrogenase-like enzyme